MAPDDTTRMSRFSACSAAMSAASDASHFSLSRPPLASTNSEEPILTTMRRKSVRRGVAGFIADFMAGFLPQGPQKWIPLSCLLNVARANSELGLVLQQRLVLQAIIAGQAADQLAPLPVIENTADVFTGNASHGGKIALSDLLANDDAASAN